VRPHGRKDDLDGHRSGASSWYARIWSTSEMHVRCLGKNALCAEKKAGDVGPIGGKAD
jgi:hypothetical protein